MRFAYTRPDGGVSIVTAAPKKDLERVLGPLTDAEYRKHVLDRSIPANAADVAELPDGWTPPDADRTFRNAWGHASGVFHVDMAKARNLWRDKLRTARAPLLAALDVQYQRADEANDAAQKAQIAQKKQALRDVTTHPDIDAAATPDDLRKVWPAALNG